jgi:hypothetical protein
VTASEASAERSGEGRLVAAIFNKVVRVITDYAGRGPTRARAYIQDDLVSVAVQDTLTKGERSLVQGGRAEVVMTMGPTPHWSRSCSRRARTVTAPGWLTDPLVSEVTLGRPKPSLGLTAGRRALS